MSRNFNLLIPGSCLSPNNVGTMSIGSKAVEAKDGDDPGSYGDKGDLNIENGFETR